MSLLAEVNMEQHYVEMREYVTAINRVWSNLNEGEQQHIRELGNDLYDTWEKLDQCYCTHDEDQFEYVMSLFLSIIEDYKMYATWATIRN